MKTYVKTCFTKCSCLLHSFVNSSTSPPILPSLPSCLCRNHSIVDGKHVDLWPFALFFGVAISITAFPVLARVRQYTDYIGSYDRFLDLYICICI